MAFLNSPNLLEWIFSILKYMHCGLLASERAPASPTSTASPRARALPFTPSLQNSRCRESKAFSIWEFFTADVEGIKRICAVGAVLEEVFFGFGELFSGFVFAEAVAAAAYASGLEGEDKVVVVLAVEKWHQALLAGKPLVDEQIFFIVAHRIADIYSLHIPAVRLELVGYYPAEILFVDGIV